MSYQVETNIPDRAFSISEIGARHQQQPNLAIATLAFAAVPCLTLGVLIGMASNSLKESGEKLSLQKQLKTTSQEFEQFRLTVQTQNQLLEKICTTVEELNHVSD